MRFAEFHVGQTLTAGPFGISEDEILRFARAYDPQPFHTDPAYARASRWGGLIASGWHTCALTMKAICDEILAGSESIGSPGVEQLRWPAPVRPGDVLRLRAEVLEVRRSQSKPIGVLRWRWRVLNQHDVEVLSMEATSLFDLSSAAGA